MNAIPEVAANQPLDTIRLAWRSAFGDSRVIYLSGPITSGPRFVRWFEAEGHRLKSGSLEYQRLHREKVVRPNETDLQMTAELLRASRSEPVIEPASLFVKTWGQGDYIRLWEAFIEDHASRILLMPGWECSVGCVAEYSRAHEHGIPTTTIDGTPIVLRDGLKAIEEATSRLREMKPPPADLLHKLEAARGRIKVLMSPVSYISPEPLRKDASLDSLAEIINVAQFVSFEPINRQPKQAFSRVLGQAPNARFTSITEAAETLLRTSPEGSINVRTFSPDDPQSRPLRYGLRSIDEIVSVVNNFTNDGLNTILNETVDIHDGGVSGVLIGNVIEFAPDALPRAVEEPGIASLPLGWGLQLLTSVYGFEPDVAVPSDYRLEFSIHPKPRGWRNTHTLGWEIAESPSLDLPPLVQWPNRFSRMIGDKVFGLLVAHHIGLPVPKTTVINRRVAPFTFGQPTSTKETWLRTAPTEQVPGKYTTTRGWVDPFELLASEDKGHDAISSVLAQAGVSPEYSGASIVLHTGERVIEGVRGPGEAFMQGVATSEPLPSSVRADVEDIHELARQLGPVRFEWVHDGERAWVVQLHKGATSSERGVVVRGDAKRWVVFNVTKGLDALQRKLRSIRSGTGILLSAEVGLTSHFADVLRKAKVPARVQDTSPREE